MRKIAICLSVAWLSRATRAVLADELFVIVWKITGPVYTCYAVGSRVGKSESRPDGSTGSHGSLGERRSMRRCMNSVSLCDSRLTSSTFQARGPGGRVTVTIRVSVEK